MDDVRDRINDAIEKSGLKRSVVATRARLTPQKLCDITRKRRKLDANEVLDICVAIGITPNELLIVEHLPLG